MKKLSIPGLLFVSISLSLFSHSAGAIVVADCFEGTHTAFMWRQHCRIGVVDHPDILGVTHVRTDSTQTGIWYQNNVLKGILGPSPTQSTSEQLIARDPGPPILMEAIAVWTNHQATKFFLGQGITWNNFCVHGEFLWKSIGTWIKITSEAPDDDFCKMYSTE